MVRGRDRRFIAPDYGDARHLAIDEVIRTVPKTTKLRAVSGYLVAAL